MPQITVNSLMDNIKNVSKKKVLVSLSKQDLDTIDVMREKLGKHLTEQDCIRISLQLIRRKYRIS